MKLALCVFPVPEDRAFVFDQILDFVEAAAGEKCDLIVFPEASWGGIDGLGSYPADAKRCLAEDSTRIAALQKEARLLRIGIGLGYLEHSGGGIYDSFLLLDQAGRILFNYRRISSGWLPSNADPKLYRCGTEMGFVPTEWGDLGILLCGDLFEEEITRSLAAHKPDLVLHAMARAFPHNDNIQQDWDKDEFPWYLAEYAKLGAPVAAVNLLDPLVSEGCVYCGGAWLVREGKILRAKELLSPGLLIADLPDRTETPAHRPFG